MSQEESVSAIDLLADLQRNMSILSAFSRNNLEQFFVYFRPDFHPEDFFELTMLSKFRSLQK